MANESARIRSWIAITLLCCVCTAELSAQVSDERRFAGEYAEAGPAAYPQIRNLANRDPLFSQLADDIALSRRAFAGNGVLPPLTFYRYKVRGDEDLYTIAARTNLGIEAIATINGLEGPDTVSPEMVLILPNIPGVFTALNARNDLERMTLALRYPRLEEGVPVVAGSKAQRSYIFFPDEKFDSIERAFFLGILFRFPLREGYISSVYGMRTHPITGIECLHSGIDIAAPLGSDVLAARGGVVVEKGWDPDGLGSYLLLSHEGGYLTLYGHLASIHVSLNQEVKSGSLIGTVGMTGLSTGPHLHFEVRNEGGLRDPIPLIHGIYE